MAFIYGDPNTAGPFASFQIKDSTCKAIKLTNANFSTAGVNTLVAALPADASIIGFTFWNKTVLSGGGITAGTIAVGTASGTYGILTPVTGIFQPYNIPYSTGDIQIWVNGTATTGNPTAGEFYLLINYVR
jgi:hypothetical protein